MWLRGYFEGCMSADIVKADVDLIRDTLARVRVSTPETPNPYANHFGLLGGGQQRAGNFDVKKG